MRIDSLLIPSKYNREHGEAGFLAPKKLKLKLSQTASILAFCSPLYVTDCKN
jgi:hypothetical protein